ncbi:MAG: hypothetical protein HC831_02185 [Chloroflexia bacterium]|nr:hypothetical protein [Chloroflexia bacterium]
MEALDIGVKSLFKNVPIIKIDLYDASKEVSLKNKDRVGFIHSNDTKTVEIHPLIDGKEVNPFAILKSIILSQAEDWEKRYNANETNSVFGIEFHDDKGDRIPENEEERLLSLLMDELGNNKS